MKIRNAVVISLLSIFGLILPNFSLAQGFIASAFLGAFSVLYGLIFNILGTITGAFLGLAVTIFNWVSSSNFISLSYTRLDNPFIEVGWTLTRDLTNIFFVLAMVAIGLGTALRITGYQAQKALPTLIIIALLINFTPVIAGLVVDASNIVMNFFVQGGFAGANSFANFAFSQWGNISSLVGGLKFWDPTASNEATAAAVGSFVLVFFNLIAGIIYLLFAIIFILRYIAIWTLVILSPLAFACYILPATQKIFSQWWKQFFQWSLVGPIAAFFLYLADHFIRTTTSKNFLTNSMAEIGNAPGLAPIINSILPYFIAIIFLFIGLMMSLTFAPTAAGAVIKAGQKGGKLAGKAVLGKTWEMAQEKMKTRAAAEKAGQWLARKPMVGLLMGKPLLRYAEKRRDDFETGEKAVQNWRSENIAAQIGRMPELQKAGALKVLAERGHANQVKEAEQIKILMAAKEAGKEKDIIKFLPQHAEKIGFRGKTGTAAIDEALRAQKPADIEKLDKSIFENYPNVVKRIPHVYSPEKLAKLGYHGSEITDKVQEAFESEYRTNRDELIKNNAPGLRYLHTAMGGFFKPVGSLEEIEGKAKSGGTRPRPPAGVPFNWVPGPGGTWVPPGAAWRPTPSQPTTTSQPPEGPKGRQPRGRPGVGG